ncbi:MAG: PAS domain S-box protein [Nitrospirae bacterium]|nr:PAS domain S-box protein [Nitrospirota bacterium]
MKYFTKRSLALSGIIFFTAGNLAHILFPDTYWILPNLHSSIEAIGAVCALLLALLIMLIRKYHPLSFFYVWIVCGLTGMGILDLFHSFFDQGEAFVWLHSIAVFAGGLFFAMVWLPEQKIPARYLSHLPGATLITALLSGLLSVLLPDFIPAMLLEGNGFTRTAILINHLAGLLFIAAAVWFVKGYIKDKAMDSLLFSVSSFFFGIAGLLFYFSDLWNIGWWHWHAVRIAAYLVSIYYALSIYKKLTDQIQDQKDKAQQYLDVAASILAVLDVHEKVVLINRKGCMLLECREEEIAGSNWFDTFLPERARDDARLFFRKLIADKIDHNTHSETLVLTKTGDERLIAWHNTILKDEAGNIKHVLISGEDVTDRKKAEDDLWKAHLLLEARVKERTIELEKANILLNEEITRRTMSENTLRKSEQQLEKAQAMAHIGSWEWDIQSNLVTWSDEVYRIYGYQPGEIKPEYGTVEKAMHPESKKIFLESIDSALQGESPYELEYTIFRKDGQTSVLHTKGEVVRDSAGRPVKMFGVVQDITERKKMEDRIRASLREKEVLLREVHHRVKNNMTVISSLLKLQADKVRDGHYKELLNESINRIKTMALIHEKLYRSDNLARIVFSDYLKDMIDNILGSYGINARAVHFKKDLERVILPLDASIPCGLIVNELLCNALKYAFPDGRDGEIRVSLRRNNGNVELTVGDDGIGLPADMDFGNAGSLGLNIVNALVRQIRGNIELRRERGTEFLITFRSDAQ